MERRKATRLASRAAHAQGPGARTDKQSTTQSVQNQSYSYHNPIKNTRSGVETGSLGGGPLGFVECKPTVGRAARRTLAGMFVERAAWLLPADRALVEACHGEGLSVAAYVRRCLNRGIDPVSGDPLAGGEPDSESDSLARITRRRLRTLEKRLASDRFAFVIARGSAWPSPMRRVAVTCIVQGRSMREAVRELGLSLHTVRRHMHGVESLFAEHADTARRAREAVRRVASEQDRRDGSGWAR